MLSLPRCAKSKVSYCTLIQWAATPLRCHHRNQDTRVSESVRDVCLSSRGGTNQVFSRRTSVSHLLSVSERSCSVSAATRVLSRHLPCAKETGVSVNPYVAHSLRGCGETARWYVGSGGGLRDGKWSTSMPNFFSMLLWNRWTFYTDTSIYKTLIRKMCAHLNFSCVKTWNFKMLHTKNWWDEKVEYYLTVHLMMMHCTNAF